MRPARDITGMRSGRLVAIRQVPAKRRNAMWLVRCDCGNEAIVVSYGISKGSTKSCGCLVRDTTGLLNRTHGDTGTRLFSIWQGMRARCENPKARGYQRYGGRGIHICDEWHDFAVFRAWAQSHGYQECLSIDRIDNDGHYEPSNCRWANMIQQARNRSNTKLYDYAGRTGSVKEHAEIEDVSYSALFHRLKGGQPIGEAIAALRAKGLRYRELWICKTAASAV